MTSAWGITVFRVASALFVLALGLFGTERFHWPSPLVVALFALGAFIAVHVLVEAYFQRLRTRYAVATRRAIPAREPPQDVANSDDSGFRDFATSFIATSGVILGLLAVFGGSIGTSKATLKVGIASLATDILLGFLLVGLVLSAPPQDDQQSWNVIRIIFNLSLWALSLGLLCIAMALIYRR